ncbi:unnamed protein product [Cyprideis torosa]|uniref:Uncharacterized protein n=1 Tax=Cyprideis torosa TaxID=163714 RepID=A0A7R8WLK6_9CRUS|nr:unnamed protein product [Cyprideis torosa]CAG0902571.1 unnamed protein product [Cyprideis torosa]
MEVVPEKEPSIRTILTLKKLLFVKSDHLIKDLNKSRWPHGARGLVVPFVMGLSACSLPHDVQCFRALCAHIRRTYTLMPTCSCPNHLPLFPFEHL